MKPELRIEVVEVPHPDTQHFRDLTRQLFANLIVSRAQARLRGEEPDPDSMDVDPLEDDLSLDSSLLTGSR